MTKFVQSVFYLFLLGAIMGSVCDGFHTHSGTTFYPHPWYLKMAWWVPLLFGAASVAIGLSHVLMDKILRRSAPDVSWPGVILGLFFFVTLYYLSAFLPGAWTIKLLVLAAGSLLLWFLFDRTWQGVLMAMATAIVGCYAEIQLSAGGAFGYLHPNIWGIPYWLGFLYVSASITVGNLARKLI